GSRAGLRRRARTNRPGNRTLRAGVDRHARAVARTATAHRYRHRLRRAVEQKYIRTLAEMPDEYLRERAGDVRDVTHRVMRNLMGSAHRGLEELPSGTIVVAYDLSPSDTSSLDRKNVVGFATDVG